jgi:hypothetical protein
MGYGKPVFRWPMSNLPGLTIPAVINLGSCWGTPNGQDLSMPSYMASGTLCVAEAILRRWTTSQGQLIDDPNYGYNITDLIGADLGPRDISYAQQQAAAEALKDERVLAITVTLTLSVAGLLQVVANGVTAAGPFQFVASVSNVTTQLLLVSP